MMEWTGNPAAKRAPIGGWVLPVVDATRWIGTEPPDRRFVIDQWLVRGTGALLVGEDGIGKSLLGQQLATCVAAGKSFLGLTVIQAPALYVTCEDDESELWRRQRTINAALGVPIDAAPATLSSLTGYTGVELGVRDQMGRLELSYVGKGIIERAKQHGAALIVLDNLARLFDGNENDRHDVAEFCALLERMAIETDATVLLVAHPSKSGAEYSGSTGWSAHVRQRLWFARQEDESGVSDRDARVLRKSKSNYAESGTEIALRWHRWAFVRDADIPSDTRAEMAATARAASDNAIFLTCLRERLEQHRHVSATPSPNYAPTQFDRMVASQKIGKARLVAAMERLFAMGRIETAFLWRDSGKGRDVHGLREVPPNASPNRPQTLSPNGPELLPQTPPNIHSIPKGITGAAFGAAAPDPDSTGMILAPGETGDFMEL